MPEADARPFVGARAERLLAAGFLVLAALLAVTSLLGDSPTYDEVIHVPAGIVHLRTGDLRLAPDHPPLARLWAALPSILFDLKMPDPRTPDFRSGNFLQVGRTFLFGLNPVEPLLTACRLMIVGLFLSLLLLVRHVARRLFGENAGLYALAVASLSPTLLAHGRLVTTDLAAALAFLATIVAFAAFAARPGPFRILLSAVALGALAVTKYSWPLVLPALLAMGAFLVFRREPLAVRRFRGAPRVLVTRWARAAYLAGVAAGCTLAVFSMVWACYGFRYSPYRGLEAAEARMFSPWVPGRASPTTDEEAWDVVLHDQSGEPDTSPEASFVRALRARKALPEAYLYGALLLKRMSYPRTAYLSGRFGAGWPEYFPIALLVKTPIPLLLLVFAGLSAIVSGRARPRDSILAMGLVVFGAVYGLAAVAATINVGARHLLPLEPLLAVSAGAAAAWISSRAGRVVLVMLALWLCAETAAIHPGYLGYFNEIAGGWKHGDDWLADSNVDWGQDLSRLASWAKSAGDPGVKLAYFGSADPSFYGFRATNLASSSPFGEPASITPGLYAASVNQLLGLLLPTARDAFWESPANRDWYRRRWEMARGSGFARPSGLSGRDATSWDAFEQGERGRILRALRHRPPDARAGTSIRIYRLSQAELDAILRP